MARWWDKAKKGGGMRDCKTLFWTLEDRVLVQIAAQHIPVDGNLPIVRNVALNSEVLHQFQRPRRCVVLLL